MNKDGIYNLFDVLEKQKENMNIAYKYHHQVISYYCLYRRVITIADFISSDKDIVGLFFENSIDYIIAFFAVLYCGKTVLPISTNNHLVEINKMQLSTGFDLILTNSENIKNINNINVDVLNINMIDNVHQPTVIKESGNEVAVIFPTSGTTGRIKFVQLTHENILSSFLGISKIYKLKEDECGLAMIPFTSALSLSVDLLPAMWAGMPLIIFRGGFSHNKFRLLMVRDKVNYMVLVPSLFRLIFKVPEQERNMFSHLKRISLGGEKITVEEIRDFNKWFPHIVVIQGYGMTEAGPVITTTTYDDYLSKVGSVGRPMEGIRVKVADRWDNELPAHQEGMIYAVGSNIMKGYLNQDTEIIKNGWLETGDIGYLDKDGYLYLTGRNKNIIIVGGQNVFPEEIEGIIRLCGIVREVKVYGKNNAINGEIVVADIVLESYVADEDGAVKEIKNHCLKLLASYKIPKKIFIKSGIEKTANSKTKR